jgi:regulatory protein
VKRKLYDYGLKTFEIDELIADLIQSNYLNEERFARSFARGKSKVKKWGRNKILSELRLRKISDYCIRKAMTEIDDELYSETLRALIEKKNREYKSKNEFEQRAKIARFLMGKGYESDLVWEAVKELV